MAVADSVRRKSREGRVSLRPRRPARRRPPFPFRLRAAASGEPARYRLRRARLGRRTDRARRRRRNRRPDRARFAGRRGTCLRSPTPLATAAQRRTTTTSCTSSSTTARAAPREQEPSSQVISRRRRQGCTQSVRRDRGEISAIRLRRSRSTPPGAAASTRKQTRHSFRPSAVGAIAEFIAALNPT